MNVDLSLRSARQRRFLNMALVNFAIFGALAGLLLILIYHESDWEATAGVLMIAMTFSGSLAWRRLQLLRTAVMPDFLTLILFNHFVLKVLTLLGLIAKSVGDPDSLMVDHLSGLGSVPLEYQFQAELVFLLATVIFALVWRFQEGKKLLALWHEPPSKQVWISYGLLLIVYVGLKLTGNQGSIGALGEMLRLFALGAVAVLLGGTGPYALGRERSWLAILALFPSLLMALQSGMKSEVAIVTLPILLPIVRRLTATRVAVLGGFLVFVVLFVFPFSQAWREANWNQRGGPQNNADVSEVASRVRASWDQIGLLETAQISTAQWLSRSSTSEAGGLVMQLADRDGLIGPVLIEGLVSIFIPRFLWPEKPTYAPGAWFTWYLGWASSPETATTATATMLPTEIYWMFGLAGVVIGMVVISVIYFHVWRFMIRESVKGILPTVALFAMLGRTSGLEETNTIYAIAGPIILVAYVIILDRLLRLMPWFGGRPNERKAE